MSGEWIERLVTTGYLRLLREELDRGPVCECASELELPRLDDLDPEFSFFLGGASPKTGRVQEIGGRMTDVFMIL